MKVINTSTTDPASLTPWERSQIYNGLDCCLTAEILDALVPQMDDYTRRTYDFSRALQGPALEMRLRGVRVDARRKSEVIDAFYETLEVLETNLNRLVAEGCGLWNFNWKSPADLRRVFYDILQIPTITKGGKATADRDALERLEAYMIARPIVSHIITMKDIFEKVKVLKSEIDPDGRVRCSYNIGGTDTGRFSSSFSEFGTGRNLQNIEESLRQIFISDPGMKMGYFDGEQIQSRIVGAVEYLLGYPAYLDACETGDLHTTVAKMTWTDLAWTGDNALDRALAEQPFYRHHDRRFMCKKLGHGSNFDGKAHELARQTKIDVDLVQEFQIKYFRAFPGHRVWKVHVENELLQTGTIIALTGRKRQFWGRRNEAKTVREALAYEAQADEAFIVNSGMLNVWRARDATLYMHDHDALTVQYPEEMEDEIVPKILAQLRVPVPLDDGRELVVPFGCKTGWNKGEYNAQTNPEGLKTYRPGDKRTRGKEVDILDRRVR